MTPIRIILMSTGEAPWPWFTINAEGQALQNGLLRPGATAPEVETIDHLIVPGADVVVRRYELPDRNDVQARSAVAFLIQEDLAQDGEDLHIAVGRAGEDGLRLAAIARESSVMGWMEAAAGRGVTPTRLTPDHLMLPAPEDDGLVGARFGDLLAIRGREMNFSGEPDLAEAVLAGRAWRKLSPQERDMALIRAALDPDINLLQGGFGGSTRPAEEDVRPRRAILLAAALLVSPLVIAAAGIGHDLVSAWSLQAKAEKVARAAWPSIAKTDDPVAAMRSRIAARQTADRFTGLAAALFAAVEKTPGAQLDKLTYGPEAVLRASVSYANYSDMDQLVAAGRGAGLDITADSTVTEGARITSDLTIRSRP